MAGTDKITLNTLGALMNFRLFTACSIAALGMAASAQSAAQSLHLYIWSDYMAKDTVSNFEKATGIKVTTDYYDSNEVLEAKMLAGRSGYDIVFPPRALCRPFNQGQALHPY